MTSFLSSDSSLNDFHLLPVHFLMWCLCVGGGKDGRNIGWSSSDPTRRRTSGPIANDGILSREKAPLTNDLTGSKDAMVRVLYMGCFLHVKSFYFLQKSKMMVALCINF